MPLDWYPDADGDVQGRNNQLMLAYSVHELELCPKCGYPREVCGSDAGFQAQKRVCYASAAVETAQEAAEKANSPEHGVMWLPSLHDEKAPGGAAKPPPGMFSD